MTMQNMIHSGMDTIREQVKQHIEASDTSQRQIALSLGLAPQYISAILNGPSESVPKSLIEVIRHLGLQLTLTRVDDA